MIPENKVLLRHIKRLQERNALLAECLADERKFRQTEQKAYRKVISSPFRRFTESIMYAVCNLAEQDAQVKAVSKRL